ncbi:MAG: MBL fold metallo-hydrolase [Planctomycetes bacterium]|nr:MBL fold metallo-hydrolase [Planctomycetota bacterium]
MVKVLNPGGSTAVVLSVPAGDHVLFDMQVSPALGFQDALAEAGVEARRISAVLLTHLHSDHFSPPAARWLLKASECIFAVGRTPFEDVAARQDDYSAAIADIHDAGRLVLLDGSGRMEINGHGVAYASTTHGLSLKGVSHPQGNTAYRVRNVLVGGDTPVTQIFSPRAECVRAPGVEVLCVNLAHFSRQDVAEQDYPELRKHRWRTEHGMVEDLLAAMRSEEHSAFFRGLRTLIPCHVRRQPRDGSLQLYEREIAGTAAECGYCFEVSFGGC